MNARTIPRLRRAQTSRARVSSAAHDPGNGIAPAGPGRAKNPAPARHALKLTGARCQCTACGEYFTSKRAFDRHRMGEYAKPGQWQGTRRCMTQAEMDAAGFERNAKGFRGEPGRARVATHSAIPAHRSTPAMVEPTPAPAKGWKGDGRASLRGEGMP